MSSATEGNTSPIADAQTAPAAAPASSTRSTNSLSFRKPRAQRIPLDASLAADGADIYARLRGSAASSGNPTGSRRSQSRRRTEDITVSQPTAARGPRGVTAAHQKPPQLPSDMDGWSVWAQRSVRTRAPRANSLGNTRQNVGEDEEHDGEPDSREGAASEAAVARRSLAKATAASGPSGSAKVAPQTASGMLGVHGAHFGSIKVSGDPSAEAEIVTTVSAPAPASKQAVLTLGNDLDDESTQGPPSGPAASSATPAKAAKSPATASRVTKAAPPTAACELADAVGNTPLINAVRASDTLAISALLAGGVDVNAPNAFTGETALAVACQNGDIEATSVLLSAEADPNTADAAGYSPLHHAIRSRHDPVVRALITASADVDTLDSVGESALLHAVDEKLPSVVRLLLEQGANIELTTPSGETPLMRAARTNNPGITRMLLLHGCDVRARNNQGDKAYDIAVACGSFDVTKRLLREDPVQRAATLHAEAEARQHGLAATVGVHSRRMRRGSFGAQYLSATTFSTIELSRIGADPEDDDNVKIELDLAFGLSPDVWDIVKRCGLQGCADRLANIAELRTAADFNRVGRRALVRAGLSPREVFTYLTAVRLRLEAEFGARASLHSQDLPWIDRFASCKALGGSIDRFFGISSCCRCLCFCCASPVGFGDGVEERAVAAATAQQRAALARETLEAMDEHGLIELEEEFDPDSLTQIGCCSDPALPGVFRCCSCIREPSRLAVAAMGGVIGHAQGIEFFGPGGGASAAAVPVSKGSPSASVFVLDIPLGSTVTPGARYRMQRQAALDAARRHRELSVPGGPLYEASRPQDDNDGSASITWGTLLVGNLVRNDDPVQPILHPDLTPDHSEVELPAEMVGSGSRSGASGLK